MSSLYFRFKVRGAGSAALPLLDRLLARADEVTAISDWRAQAIRTAGPFAAAPLALYAASGPISGAWACMATPVHYRAEMSNVRLSRDGILRLSEATAAALAADFNRVWHDSGIRMTVGRFADLFCVFDLPLQVITQDPEAVLDRHIEDFLPAGADAARLRRLMSETEMWLFEHAATRADPARGSLGINGLWLWGGGPINTTLSLPDIRSAGEDVLFNYFHGDVSTGGVVSAPAPGSHDWPYAQARWLEPAVQALKSGQLARVQLSGGDRCFTVRAASLRRFWRRDRPWREHFE